MPFNLTQHSTKSYLYIIGLIFFILFIFVGATFYAFNAFEKPITGVDDANISFVYARHLVDGHGFVYNIGGERVEGFTTLLWVLISALFFSITSQPEIILLIINIILLVTANSITFYYLYRSHQNIDVSIIVAYLVLIMVIPDYITWMTLPLMETGVWSFLLIASAITVLMINKNSGLRFRLLLSFLIGLLLLTRPEAIAWGLLFIFLTALQMTLMADFRSALKFSLLPTLTYVIVLAGLTMFRTTYFGYPLPNTYYAKVSPSLIHNLRIGLEYFLSYLNSGFLITLLIFFTLIFFSKDIFFLVRDLKEKKYQSPESSSTLKGFSLGLICFIGLLLPILPGGDHFKSFRFYQPIYPLLVVYLLINFNSIIKERSLLRWVTITGLILITIFVNVSHQVTWRNVGVKGASILVEFRIAKQGRERGELLSSIFKDLDEYPSVGTITSGGIKMTYTGEVIDLLGLNNLQMGHSSGLRQGTKNHAAFNQDVFFQLKPDIVGSNCKPLNPLYLPGLSDDPDFQKLYECATVRRVGEKGKYQGFFRNEFLDHLSQDDRFKIELATTE